MMTHSKITKNAEQAANWLQQGHLLAYPTESVWGLGCDAFNEAAIKQILAIKQRPISKGMIVVTDNVNRIQPLLMVLPEDRRQQVIKSWQLSVHLPSLSKHQANTWLLPVPQSDLDSKKLIKIPQWITGSHDYVAVRVISHPLVQKLCQNCVSQSNPYGFIVSTSCNPSGAQPATTLKQAYRYFKNRIYYLEGETLDFTLPSQIKNAITGNIVR